MCVIPEVQAIVSRVQATIMFLTSGASWVSFKNSFEKKKCIDHSPFFVKQRYCWPVFMVVYRIAKDVVLSLCVEVLEIVFCYWVTWLPIITKNISVSSYFISLQPLLLVLVRKPFFLRLLKLIYRTVPPLQKGKFMP